MYYDWYVTETTALYYSLFQMAICIFSHSFSLKLKPLFHAILPAGVFLLQFNILYISLVPFLFLMYICSLNGTMGFCSFSLIVFILSLFFHSLIALHRL